jgi:adenine-specific DNA glycosylase
MWEFPHGEVANAAAPRRAAARLTNSLTGIRADRLRELLTVRHSVTRFQITMRCFLARFRAGRFRSPFYVQARWVEPARLQEYPVSAPQRLVARTLVELHV